MIILIEVLIHVAFSDDLVSVEEDLIHAVTVNNIYIIRDILNIENHHSCPLQVSHTISTLCVDPKMEPIPHRDRKFLISYGNGTP
jgi:hypothetical protein